VSELIAEPGLALLCEAGFDVDVRADSSVEELRQAMAGAAGLIIRSATQVDEALLDAAPDLLVVGRAGVGLDNVDVAAATKRGVMVVNAPESNITSAAEHTMAMLLAQARNIPQAHAALVAGRWERSKWEGVEVAGKTLGIVGLGRIGTLVAKRAQAFGMTVVGHDPFVAADMGRRLDVELLDLAELMSRADFVTVHVAKTPETIGLLGKDMFARSKPGQRIVNVARGGIVDELALAEAVRSGQLGGAAIDVFDSEPSLDSPLFDVAEIVVTPHLGASTREAQDRAGVTIAEQVRLALEGEFVPFAVNVDAGNASEPLRAHLPVCEQLGLLFANIVEQIPSTIDLELRGAIGESDPSLGVLSFLKGLLTQMGGEPVSAVNASDVAKQRGIDVRVITTSTARDHLNTVSVTGGGHRLAGSISAVDDQPRLLEIDGHRLELRLSNHMLIVRNEDVPGMVGHVGSVVGDAGINISNMHIGETEEGVAALMVMAIDGVVSPGVQASLRALSGVKSVTVVRLR